MYDTAVVRQIARNVAIKHVPPRLRSFAHMAHALRKPLPPADPRNPRVYVDVCLGAEEEAGMV